MTFNIRYGAARDGENRWEARRELLLETIDSVHPDIFGVQESQPFQGDEIAMRFPGYARIGLGRYHGVAVDRPHEAFSGEHCDLYLDSAIYLAVRCGTFWHSDHPDTAGSITWGNSLARITTWCEVASRADASRFMIFNTHLHSGEPYLAGTGNLMVERMRSLGDGLPAILMGDFNAVRGDEIHRRFTATAPYCAGLLDVWTRLGYPEEGAGTAHGFTGIPERRIDWILTSPEFAPTRAEVIYHAKEGRYPSDHYPLVCELALGS